MARKLAAFLILTLLTAASLYASDATGNQDLIKKILAKAKENEKLANDIGFEQSTIVKKMDDGKVVEEETKVYRLTWIQNQPYLEMVKMNGKDLDEKTKKDEAEKKAKFIKSLNTHEKADEDEDDLTWEDLYAKYDFQELPSDSVGKFVFSFKPKSGKLAERSRPERILNHVSGKFWVDENYNIVRAEANLMDTVKFGWGILGKIEKLHITYEQQDFGQIRMPSSLYVYFKAHIAVLKTEERQIQATYTNFFHRPTSGKP